MFMKKQGVTFIEILVSLVILSLILSAVAAALFGGFRMLKQAEFKSRAMGIAYFKMSQALSKTYSGSLNNTTVPQLWTGFNDTEAEFFWSITATPEESDKAHIPYKNITVVCSYAIKNPDGTLDKPREVRLSNIIPYPYIHSRSKKVDWNETTGNYPLALNASQSDRPDPADFRDILSPEVIGFNFEVNKDLVVLYNLAIEHEPDFADQEPPPGNQTVYTECLMDNKQIWGITTRTPIISQPFINNALVIQNVSAEPHTLQIRWCKDPSNGKVKLRSYEITVLAYENITWIQ